MCRGRFYSLVLPLLLALLCQQPLRAQYGADGNYDSDDGDELGLYIVGAILAGVVASAPIWAPHLILEESGADPGFFFEHPHYGHLGDYMYLGNRLPDGAAAWSVTLASEYGTDFDVERLGTRLALDTTSRFGLDCEWNQLWGELEGRPWDEMETGDFHILWRFAQHPRVQFRAGAGFRWLSDVLDTNYGFSGHYGLEVQPVKPLLMSVHVEGGALRHDPFLHGRIALGMAWKHFEVFAGFDYLQIDSLELAGPTAGLRLWL